MAFLVVIIVLALIFDYINGFHDAANSIATIVSTKVLPPFQAVLLMVMGRPAYRFAAGGIVTVFADTGEVLPDIRRQEAHQGEHQQAGVQAFRAVHLKLSARGERPALVGAAVAVPEVHGGVVGLGGAGDVDAAPGLHAFEDAAKRALSDLGAVRPYDPGSPCEIVVDFNTSDHVEKYRYRSGVEITDSRQIASRADDWWTAWSQFFF